MQKLDRHQARAIGVSNFSVKRIRELLAAESTTVVPAANQVELHPLLPQKELLDECSKHNIIVEAYSPLGSTNSPLLTDPVVTELAEKYGVGAATILVLWALWRGTVVLPKSVTPQRIVSNFEVVDLQQEEGERLDAILKNGEKRFISPDFSPVVVFD